MNTSENESFARKVWENLRSVDISRYVEKKLKLNYLSWANAWAILINEYPESAYIIDNDIIHPDGSVTVSVTMTVKDGKNHLTRTMTLPVMDHKNKAIKNPDAFDHNKNVMRCLVKVIAMFGLGINLYTGEDLPSDVNEVKQQQAIKNNVDTITSEKIKTPEERLRNFIEYTKKETDTSKLKANYEKFATLFASNKELIENAFSAFDVRKLELEGD